MCFSDEFIKIMEKETCDILLQRMSVHSSAYFVLFEFTSCCFMLFQVLSSWRPENSVYNPDKKTAKMHFST